MRKVIQLAGHLAQFALADDSTIWLWTDNGWQSAHRGPLPQDMDGYVKPAAIRQEIRDEIDQKKAELVKELGLKELETKNGPPRKRSKGL